MEMLFLAPKLPSVLEEITRRLLEDDWCRISTPDGDKAYYIVGTSAQSADVAGRTDFSRYESPLPTRLGPISDSVVRSQVADDRPDYLRKARSKLEEAGLPVATIESVLGGNLDALRDWWSSAKIPIAEWKELIDNVSEGIALTRANIPSVELSAEEKEEARIRREKRCLGELAGKYPRIVDRWEQLEPLTFVDPQLKEASKVFLYGFYRASIALCASAVEKELRRICASNRLSAFELIKAVEQSKRLSRDNADHSRDLFRVRNRVVHDDYDPTSDQAKELLGVARLLVAALRESCELPLA